MLSGRTGTGNSKEQRKPAQTADTRYSAAGFASASKASAVSSTNEPGAPA
jgi:hypothetical protein